MFDSHSETNPNPRSTGRRILLVDDDDSIVEPVRMALLERGHEVLRARDGHEAILRVERDQPDLVVLDLVMPRRSGFSVLDRIRSGPTSPRVVMVTGNAEPQYRAAAELRGADAFMAKPFDIDELLEVVESLLQEDG